MIYSTTIDTIISTFYNNPKFTSNTASQLYKRINPSHPSITLNDVQRFLSKQISAQRMYKRSTKRRPPPANTTHGITGPNQRAQMDLADLSSLSQYNFNFKWILIIIDVYSKYAVAFPMKNKLSSTVANYLQQFFTSQTSFQPRVIQSDRGSEFIASKTQSTLKQLNIKQVFSKPFSPKSNGIAEAFVKTIKGLLFSYMERTQRRTWVTALNDCLHNYNSRQHSTTKLTPNTVHFSSNPILSVQQVFQKKQEEWRRKITESDNFRSNNLFRVGDIVRLHILKDPNTAPAANMQEKARINKKYISQWGDQLYSIVLVDKPNRRVWVVRDSESACNSGNASPVSVSKTNAKTIVGPVSFFDIQKVDPAAFRLAIGNKSRHEPTAYTLPHSIHSPIFKEDGTRPTQPSALKERREQASQGALRTRKPTNRYAPPSSRTNTASVNGIHSQQRINTRSTLETSKAANVANNAN